MKNIQTYIYLFLITGLFIFTSNNSIKCQGPVIISGLDTEYGIRPANTSHGTIAMWDSVIQTTILSCVSLNPSGPILVIGGGKDISGGPIFPPDHMTSFWNQIGASLGRAITYSNSFTGDISTINIISGGWSMIAICNTVDGQGRLTLNELNDISARQAEIATFVNSGGGLFASACHIGSPPYGYINVGTPTLTSSNGSCQNSIPTIAGTSMGITPISGPFHTFFTQHPSFLNVLSTCNGNNVIVGGCRVTVPMDGEYCCDGMNLVTNGSFENGDNGFNSDYSSIPAGNPVNPNEYSVIDFNSALTVCSNWNVEDHTHCATGNNNQILVVNGQNQQSTNTNNVIWETSTTIPIQRDSQYRFCAFVNHLEQCCFDIIPELRIEIRQGGGSWNPILNWTPIAYTGINPIPCEWEEVGGTFIANSTTVDIRILIDEMGNGDGNDLAIDDISLTLMPRQKVLLSLQNQPKTNPSFFELHSSINSLSLGDDNLPDGECEYLWIVTEIADPNNPLDLFGGWSNTQLGGTHPLGSANPGWGLTTNFQNYNSGIPSGNFNYRQWYLVLLLVTNCHCNGQSFSYQILYNQGSNFRMSRRNKNKLLVRTPVKSRMSKEEEDKMINQIEKFSKKNKLKK